MRGLSASEILELCEQAWSREPVDRALILAVGACPEMDARAVARLSLGRRDALLLRARQLTFGSRVECIVDCPACAATVELAFDLARVWAGDGDGADSSEPIEIDGFEIVMRPPNSEDMQAASLAGGLEEARHMLLDRCVSVRRSNGHLPVEALPPAVAVRISQELARRDPLADVRL